MVILKYTCGAGRAGNLTAEAEGGGAGRGVPMFTHLGRAEERQGSEPQILWPEFGPP